MTVIEEAAPPREARAAAWRPTFRGIRVIAQLELRQRIRATRWKWSLTIFAALLAAATLLIQTTVGGFHFGAGDDSSDVVFGSIVYFVLFLGLLVSPTLAATSINGDNKDGTLAPLQATTLSAADIVLGKLLASWAASLAFLVVALPFMLFGYLGSNAPFGALFVTVLVLAIELLVVCALGLGWSAIVSKTSASAVLTYITVASLSVLSLVFFGLSMVTVTEPVTMRTYENVWDESGSSDRCEWNEYTWDEPRTDRVWWLLAMNPFVIVADAAPSNDEVSTEGYSTQTMLGGIKYGVRELRLGPATVSNQCWLGDGYNERELLPEEIARREQLTGLSAVWPWGLAFHAMLAGGALALAVRRVAVPHAKLTAGTRVA